MRSRVPYRQRRSRVSELKRLHTGVSEILLRHACVCVLVSPYFLYFLLFFIYFVIFGGGAVFLGVFVFFFFFVIFYSLVVGVVLVFLNFFLI